MYFLFPWCGFSEKCVAREIDKIRACCVDRIIVNLQTHWQHICYYQTFVSPKVVLGDLSEPWESNDISHKARSKAKYYGKKVQGQIEVDIHGLSPTIRAEHHGNIEFRRLNKKNGGKIIEERGLHQRRLTVRECARLQTFPDDYEFVCNKTNFNISMSEAYKLIGNAVPPVLAYNIAMRIQELWPKLFLED